MSHNFHARQGYKTVQREINSDKAVELKVFISVTSALSKIDIMAIGAQTELAEALIDNAKLWKILFLDLVNPENSLPLELKENLIGLAEFTQAHTLKVLSGEAEHDVLIDINKAVIAGLRQSATNAKTSPLLETEAA